jgi:hypothetical protein
MVHITMHGEKESLCGGIHHGKERPVKLGLCQYDWLNNFDDLTERERDRLMSVKSFDLQTWKGHEEAQ